MASKKAAPSAASEAKVIPLKGGKAAAKPAPKAAKPSKAAKAALDIEEEAFEEDFVAPTSSITWEQLRAALKAAGHAVVAGEGAVDGSGDRLIDGRVLRLYREYQVHEMVRGAQEAGAFDEAEMDDEQAETSEELLRDMAASFLDETAYEAEIDLFDGAILWDITDGNVHVLGDDGVITTLPAKAVRRISWR